jgi:hypothetical protein
MPLDLNSMRCQSQEVARYFGVVLRFLGVICFICGVRSDDAKEFQNNREYYVLYEHKNNLNPKKCVCVWKGSVLLICVLVGNWFCCFVCCRFSARIRQCHSSYICWTETEYFEVFLL